MGAEAMNGFGIAAHTNLNGVRPLVLTSGHGCFSIAFNLPTDMLDAIIEC